MRMHFDGKNGCNEKKLNAPDATGQMATQWAITEATLAGTRSSVVACRAVGLLHGTLSNPIGFRLS